MPTLLHIDSGPLYSRSVTRDAFLAPHLQAVQTYAQTFQGGHA